ncbi:uncharacterized protein LOC125545451 [Triticum urartu]|uniref:uncharacterized protein LOC125545451 n=1 Tax=Triticum urartu TaxID=4572 RepID=UPI002042F9AD|nr:uncharacterized protein LOC125545451 [Triticum urartu]
MNGYRNLASSPPAPSGGEPEPEPAPPPAAAKEGKWEGAAVGAAAMVRNLSSASQRFAAVERSKSTGGHRGGGGFQAAVRRAFSMRRQPASGLSEGYWRIHDGLDDAEDEAEAPEEVDAQKKTQVAEAAVPGDAAASNDEIGQEETKKKKKRGHIFKACKKLLGFKHV